MLSNHESPNLQNFSVARIYDHTIVDAPDPNTDNGGENDNDNSVESDNSQNEEPVENGSFSFTGLLSIIIAVLLAVVFILGLYFHTKKIIKAFDSCMKKPAKQPVGNEAAKPPAPANTQPAPGPPEGKKTKIPNKKPKPAKTKVTTEAKTSKTDVVPIIDEVATKRETKPKAEKKQKKARTSKEKPKSSKGSKDRPSKSKAKKEAKKRSASKTTQNLRI